MRAAACARPRPPAAVSVDLDDLWAYRKARDEPGWQTYPGFLDRAGPRLLDLLAGAGVRATIFVVGRDAADPGRAPLVRALAAAGHEIANHSHSHHPWLHRLGPAEMRAEIDRAEEAIGAVTGVRPRGFRGPGYSLTGAAVAHLAARGYAYDASTWPTLLAAPARWWFLARLALGGEARRERARLGGTWREGCRPLRPYRWRVPGGGDGLLELPVTTVPVLRWPAHPSFLQVPAGLGPGWARFYWRMAVGAWRRAGVVPSVVFHPTDVLGAEDGLELAACPGIGRPVAAKLELARNVLDILGTFFEMQGMATVARQLLAGPVLPPLRSWDGEGGAEGEGAP